MSYLDLTDVEESTGGGPLPAGQYLVSVFSAEERTSKTGNDYLSLEFHVADGPYAGRKIYEVFNVKHPKEEVRDIALSKLKGLLTASKAKMKLKSPSDLEGLQALATTKVGDDGYSKIQYFNTPSKTAKKAVVAKVVDDDSEELPF